jgi:membrane-bound inhibitor of C-type lysozyme
MTRTAAAALLAALLSLAACGPKQVTKEEASEALARGAESRRVPLDALPVDPSVTVSQSVAYECEGGMPVTAIYGTGPGGVSDVALVIQGYDIRLEQTPAASGARYVSDVGLEAGKGLVWWTRGDEATLADFPEGTDSMATAEVKRTCRRR